MANKTQAQLKQFREASKKSPWRRGRWFISAASVERARESGYKTGEKEDPEGHKRG
mgnify:CR=1 FL=1